MLTVRQLMTIEKLSTVPPLHVGDLRAHFGPGTLSLRSIIDKVENREAVFFAQVRDASSFQGVTNLDEFRAVVKKSTPSKETVLKLQDTLGSAGASLTYISPDRRTVGIRGKTLMLATIPCTPHQTNQANAFLGWGAAGFGAGLAILLTNPAGWVLLLGGAVLTGGGAGMAGEAGYFLMVCDPVDQATSSEPTVVTVPDAEDIYIYTDLPPGVPVEDGAHFPPMVITLDDLHDIPEDNPDVDIPEGNPDVEIPEIELPPHPPS